MCVRSGLIILLISHWWNDHGTVVYSGFSFTALPNKSSKKYTQVLNKRKRKKEVPGSNFYPSCIADSTPPPIMSLGSPLWISPPSCGPGALNHAHPVPTPHLHMEGSPLTATCPKTCNTRWLGTPACTQGSPLAGHTPSTTHRWVPTHGQGALILSQRGPHSPAGRLQPLTAGSPLAGLASSPAYRGVSSLGDQARSTAHGGVPIRGTHTLNHAHHSRDGCPSLHMNGSPVEGCVPSTPKKGVPTRGPRALNWAWRGSHPGPCAFHCARRGPHSRAARLQAHTERSPLAGPQLGMERSAPVVRAP